MSISLHTRSRCDECDRPATLQIGDIFLCERCDQIIHGAVENSDSCASRPREYASASPSSAPSPRVSEVDATNPVAKATKGKAGTAGINGPVRRSTAGTVLRVGEAVAVRPATYEVMDVTAGRDRQPNFSSGDSPSILQPGSIRQGRARERVICSAVTGNSSCGPTTLLATQGNCLGTIGTRAGNPLTEQGEPRPQDSITNPDAVSSLPVMDASENCGATRSPLVAPPFSMPAPCRDGCGCADNERCFAFSADPGPCGFDFQPDFEMLFNKSMSAPIGRGA
jgi:hypothetical protein